MDCKARWFGSARLWKPDSRWRKKPTLHFKCKCSIYQLICMGRYRTGLHQRDHCLSTICPLTLSNTEHRWWSFLCTSGREASHTLTNPTVTHEMTPSVHLSFYVLISLLVSLYPLMGEVIYHLSTALKLRVCTCTFMWMLDPSSRPHLCTMRVVVSGETLVKSSWAWQESKPLNAEFDVNDWVGFNDKRYDTLHDLCEGSVLLEPLLCPLYDVALKYEILQYNEALHYNRKITKCWMCWLLAALSVFCPTNQASAWSCPLHQWHRLKSSQT